MNRHACSMLLASALALAALLLVLRPATPTALPLPPGTSDVPGIRELVLRVPPIAALATYIGQADRDPWHDCNPFIPWAERQRPDQRLAAGDGRSVGPGDPPPPLPPPPPLALVVKEPYPPLSPAASVPIILAVVAAAHRPPELTVRFDQGGPVRLRIGDRHAGWSLHAVQGGFAQFQDPEGIAVDLPLDCTGVTIAANRESR